MSETIKVASTNQNAEPIEKYFSFVVLKSPIVKSHMPLTSLFVP